MNSADAIRDMEPTETWTNYGDANPVPHGGRFLRWNDDLGYYELVVTRNLKVEGPEGMIQGGKNQLIEHYAIYPDDLFDDDGEPTDKLESVIDALSRDYDPHNINDLEFLVPDMEFHLRGGSDSYTSSDDYWETLEAMFGITKDEAL